MRFFLFLLVIAAAAGGYYYFIHQTDDGTSPTLADDSAVQTDAPASEAAPRMADVGETTEPIHPLAPSDPSPGGFVPPEFQPLEAVVGNWRDIPPSAFPRDVTLAAPVSFQMAVGSSTLPAGSMAVALGVEGGNLIVAPSANAIAQGRVGIDDTDFKQILAGEYDAWKARMTERALLQWEYTQTAPERELRGEQALAAAAAAGVSGPPTSNGSGGSDLVRQSLASNPLRELRPEYITRVSEPALINVEGQTYWAIAVDFTAQTRFGPYPTQAQALIRNNRIERWIYTGSGEPVP